MSNPCHPSGFRQPVPEEPSTRQHLGVLEVEAGAQTNRKPRAWVICYEHGDALTDNPSTVEGARAIGVPVVDLYEGSGTMTTDDLSVFDLLEQWAREDTPEDVEYMKNLLEELRGCPFDALSSPRPEPSRILEVVRAAVKWGDIPDPPDSIFELAEWEEKYVRDKADRLKDSVDALTLGEKAAILGED